jgi:hypothetical protein
MFWDRHGTKLAYTPSESVSEAILEHIPTSGYYVFDGGLRHNKVKGIQHRIVLWDSFIWDGEFLNKEIYAARMVRLMSLGIHTDGVRDDTTLTITPFYYEDFRKHYADYVGGKHGNPDEFEGLVLKNQKGKLNLSRTTNQKSSWMFKIRKETGRHKF